MEGIRHRIWWLGIHLTRNRRVAKELGAAEQVLIEPSPETKPPIVPSDNDTVDVEKALEPVAEPDKVTTVGGAALVEDEEKCDAWIDDGGHTRRRYHAIEPVGR